MLRPHRRWMLALGAIAAAWIVVDVALASHSGLLHLAPMLVLLLPLLGGRYVGERLLSRLLEQPPRRRRRALASVLCGRVGAVALARGGALLASGVARRPPPVLSA